MLQGIVKRFGIGAKELAPAIIGGLLLTGAFPRTGLWFLAWIALVPLLWAVREGSGAEAFRTGFVMGLAHFLSLIYWIVYTMMTFGHLPVFLAVPVLFLLCAYLALYPALFCGIISRCRSPLSLFLLMPILWAGLEYLRSFLLSGFPWGLLAYSQSRQLPLIQISDLLGPYALSGLIVMVNGALFLVLLWWKKVPWKGIQVSGRLVAGGSAAAFLGLCLLAGYGFWRIEKTETAMKGAPSLRASLVQGNISQEIKWDPALRKATTEKYIDLTRSAAADNPNLVVWPETATPFYFGYSQPYTRFVLDAAFEMEISLLTGSPFFRREDENERSLFNSAFLIRPDATVSGRYDKAHLVPYGEYVPFQRYMPFIEKLVAAAGDFDRGTPGKTLHLGENRLGVLICYEIIFPYLSRAAVLSGADLLVNITNDAWYGRTSAPDQHFAQAVFRAVETRRALIRSANTGISGFIDPTGRPHQTTDLFTEAVATRKVPLIREMTLYARTGDIFGALCLFTGLAFWVGCMVNYYRKSTGPESKSAIL